VSPANEHEREEVNKLAEEIQQASGENVELAYYDVEQGYTGQRASGLAAAHGIRLVEVLSSTRRPQGRLRALAEEVGGGTRFRMGMAVQAAGEGS
jgi:hypothetical protein